MNISVVSPINPVVKATAGKIVVAVNQKNYVDLGSTVKVTLALQGNIVFSSSQMLTGNEAAFDIVYPTYISDYELTAVVTNVLGRETSRVHRTVSVKD